MALPARSAVDAWLTRSLDLLPKSDRPDIGAGYVMAAAAVVAAVVFGIVLMLLIVLETLSVYHEAYTNSLVSLVELLASAAIWLLLAGVSLVVVVPGSFVGGVVVWRFVPGSLRLHGFVGGLLSTLIGYAVSCGLVLPLGMFARVIADPSVATAVDSVGLVGLILGYAVLGTSWATVPVGVLSGYLYERSLD